MGQRVRVGVGAGPRVGGGVGVGGRVIRAIVGVVRGQWGQRSATFTHSGVVMVVGLIPCQHPDLGRGIRRGMKADGEKLAADNWRWVVHTSNLSYKHSQRMFSICKAGLVGSTT